MRVHTFAVVLALITAVVIWLVFISIVLRY